MCKTSAPKPKAPPPPAAPPPPPPPAKPLQTASDTTENDNVKKGRGSLRIDRTVAGSDSVGSGLNIPV